MPTASILIVHSGAANIRGSVSISGGQLFVFKATFYILTTVAALVLITVGALLFAMQAFDSGLGAAQSVANGSIYMSILALCLVVTVAVIFPALIMLQPFRLWHVVRAERRAVTPRQRFRGTSLPSERLRRHNLRLEFFQPYTLARSIPPLQLELVFLLLYSPLHLH